VQKITKIDSLQALRGIAALLVVMVHGSNNIVFRGLSLPNQFSQLISVIGDFGVDIFFVLSGYVMSLSVNNRGSYIVFMVDRVFRILPLYWVFTFFLAVVYILSPKNKSDFDSLASSLILIPTYNGPGTVTMFLGPGWTLLYEFVFYLTFALYFYVGINFKKTHHKLIPSAICLIVLPIVPLEFASTLFYEFMIGMIIYVARFNKLTLHPFAYIIGLPLLLLPISSSTHS
jgi:exopolysaccharide production protein ExoZ